MQYALKCKAGIVAFLTPIRSWMYKRHHDNNCDFEKNIFSREFK